jgi:hypothetical protein
VGALGCCWWPKFSKANSSKQDWDADPLPPTPPNSRLRSLKRHLILSFIFLSFIFACNQYLRIVQAKIARTISLHKQGYKKNESLNSALMQIRLVRVPQSRSNRNFRVQTQMFVERHHCYHHIGHRQDLWTLRTCACVASSFTTKNHTARKLMMDPNKSRTLPVYHTTLYPVWQTANNQLLLNISHPESHLDCLLGACTICPS